MDNIPEFQKLVFDLNKLFTKKEKFEEKFQVVWKFMTEEPTRSTYGFSDKYKTSKIDVESMRWRAIGNKEYTNDENNDSISKSIEAYTKSIAYAPVESNELLSLAYANRSAVLFKARLYDDCLLDIERALKKKYPDHLKTKLFLRQSLCFKILKPNSTIEETISMANAMQWFPDLKKKNPNSNIIEEYSNMINNLGKPRNTNTIKFNPIIKNNLTIVGGSDAIKLKKTNKDKLHIIATRDIKSSEFIYVNKPFEIIPSDDKRYTTCWHCCCQTWAGIPCDQCSNIIFCSSKCKDTAWNEYHEFECKILDLCLKYNMNVDDDWEFKLTIKILSKAIKYFGGIVELKKKIDDVDSTKDKSMIYNGNMFDVNSIDNFHRLYYHKKCSLSEVVCITSLVIMFGLETNIFGKKLKLVDIYSHKYSIILGCLILRYLMIVKYNVVHYDDKILKNPKKQTHAVIMPIVDMFVTHCDPHVTWYNYHPNLVVSADRPIKKGEKIRISTVGRYQEKPLIHRQKEIIIFTGKPCKCSACEQNLPMMKDLPSYKSLNLSSQVENELDRIMKKSDGYFMLIAEGNTDKLLKIKDTVAQMTDTFYQNVTVPCKEASLISLMLAGVVHQLGIPHSII